MLGVPRLQLDRLAQELDGSVRISGERLHAGEVVEQARAARVAAEAVLDRLARFVVAPEAGETPAAEAVLPLRRLEPLRLGADGDDHRVRLGRMSDPFLLRLEQDERARVRDELFSG